MAKRTRKQEPDANELAHSIVRSSTDASRPKNPAAVALGRLGGKKGGRARAESLSKRRLSEIAKKAAAARWKGHKKAGQESDSSS